MTQTLTKPCTKAEAQALTDRIRNAVEDIRTLVAKAHEGKAWQALGYGSWEAYVKAEFGMSRVHAHRLVKQGEVIEAIEDALGGSLPIGNIPEGVTRELRRDLPASVEEIKSRVERGETPAQAAKDMAAAQRAEKAKAKAERDAQQAKWDREQENARKQIAAANPRIAASEAAKHANGARNAVVAGQTPAAKIAELEALNDALNAKVEEQADYIAAVDAENADLKRRLAALDAVAVQIEKGGVDAILATKDERIQGLLRQVEDMSADRAKLARSRDYFRQQAVERGYVSPYSQVEIEPDQPPAFDYDLSEEAGF